MGLWFPVLWVVSQSWELLQYLPRKRLLQWRLWTGRRERLLLRPSLRLLLRLILRLILGCYMEVTMEDPCTEDTTDTDTIMLYLITIWEDAGTTWGAWYLVHRHQWRLGGDILHFQTEFSFCSQILLSIYIG